MKLARGQTAESWPKLAKADGDDGEGMVYLMTNGPRFETRAEIRQYAKCNAGMGIETQHTGGRGRGSHLWVGSVNLRESVPHW